MEADAAAAGIESDIAVTSANNALSGPRRRDPFSACTVVRAQRASGI